MNFKLKILSSLHNRKIQLSVICLVICTSFSYSQKTYYSEEVGISKLDERGMMSKIIWTKSKVAILIDPEKNCIHVFAPGYYALKTQKYIGVTLLKKVETIEKDITTFNATDANDNNCTLILTTTRDGDEEEQLRIYLSDKVYIYNFIRA